jgi:hypothetical protein
MCEVSLINIKFDQSYLCFIWLHEKVPWIFVRAFGVLLLGRNCLFSCDGGTYGWISTPLAGPLVVAKQYCGVWRVLGDPLSVGLVMPVWQVASVSEQRIV